MRVTAIIPAFNAAPFIEETVASALAQRDVEMEVIVVDDGSTDGTWELLDRFGERIRKLRQANGGSSKARNYAARFARGEWLAFLDADDLWHPEKLQRQLQHARPGIDLVYSDRENIGDVWRVSKNQSDCQKLHEGDIFEQLVLTNFITTSSVLIRKAVFDKIGGFMGYPVTGVEDWDLWLRLSHGGSRVAVCPEPLVKYRWHANSISNKHEQICKARIQALLRALASPRGRKLRSSLASRAMASAWDVAAWYVRPTNRWWAIRWLLNAIYYTPFDCRLYRQLAKYCLGGS